MWTLFYEDNADGAAQSAALIAVAKTDLTPIAHEAVSQLQAEQALD